MFKINEVKNRKILLDSNIPIHYASKGFVDRSGNILRTLMNNDNELAITPISGFEILRGENRDEVMEKYLKFLNYVPDIVMQRLYFNNGAALAEHYRRICNHKNISPVDLIIGGTIISHSYGEDKDKPLLLTTDRKDFCEPLWLTVSYHVVPAEHEKGPQTVLYLLEFNTKLVPLR